MNTRPSSLIDLKNDKSTLIVDAFGGTINDFHLNQINVNPLSFSFTKEQMPENNKAGAPYKGHFLCLGRWGEPSAGEIKAGLPNHGQFANISWTADDSKKQNTIEMNATAHLEGLYVERKIVLDNENAVFAVNEVVQNINPLGRLYNMVQHPTLAAPFLDETTIIDCNGSLGFDQALYKEISNNTLQFPLGKDDKSNDIDLRKAVIPYNGVFSFVIKNNEEDGWITAFSPRYNLLFGYVWKRSDYPWIHLWQHYTEGIIKYRGIEFGTAGIHQPFNEILNTSPILFGEKTFAFIDAGEKVSRSYFCFLHNTDSNIQGVDNIKITNEQLQIKVINRPGINIHIDDKLFHELSK